jgi:site-specific recombinase XerD
MRGRIIAESRSPGNDEPIFRNAYGRELRDIRRQWHNAVRRAGLEDKQGISFHSTRHTFACHYLQNGAAVTDLQAILGHSNLATTQVYARMVDERMRASIRALDYGMGAKGPGNVAEAM